LAHDKLRIAEFSKFALVVPETFEFRTNSGMDRIFRALGLRCVLKQHKSRGGKEFAVIETPEDAGYWRKKRPTEDLILQKKIDGDLLPVQGIASEGRLLVSIVHTRLAINSPGNCAVIAAVTLKNSTFV
jgi:hypothetical protein